MSYSTYQGPIFTLGPTHGTSGSVIDVRIPASSIAEFRTTSNHRAFLIPLRLPPGLSGATTFFGYNATFQRVDSKYARVTVGRMGTDPYREPVDGDYRIAIVTGRDWADSADVLSLSLAYSGTSTSASVPLVGGSGLGPAHILPLGGIAGTGGAGSPATPSPGAGGGWVGPPVTMPMWSAKTPSLTIPPKLRVAFGGAVTGSLPGSRVPLTAGAAGGTSGSSPSAGTLSPQPSPYVECKVEWLVEVLTPRRLRGSDKELIQEMEVIISGRLTRPDGSVIKNERATYSLVPETWIPDDDSEILDVADNLAELQKRLRANQSGTGTRTAETDSDGKIYCRMRVRLIDEHQIADDRLRLLGFKLTLGEPREPVETMSGAPAPPVLMTRAGGGAAGGAGGNDILDDLVDILVDPDTPAAVAWFVQRANDVAEALGAIPRTPQRAIGFHLERVADYLIALHAPMLLGDRTARGAVIGFMLGIPRGIYVSAIEQVEDIKLLVYDLPRKFYEWVADDPLFALEVIGSIANPAVRIVVYSLDSGFRSRIDAAIARYTGLAQQFGQILQQLYPVVRDNARTLAIAALEAFYDSFDKFVGSIAVDYLDYPTDSHEHRSFVLAFMGGDFLGYIIGSIGIPIVIGWLTAGIGTYVQALGKAGRVASIVKPLLKLAEIINRIRVVVQRIVSEVGLLLKEAWGRVIAALASFLSRLEDAFEPIFRMLARVDDALDRFIGMLLKYVQRDIDRCDGLIEGIADLRRAGVSDEAIQDLLTMLGRQAEGTNGFVPTC